MSVAEYPNNTRILVCALCSTIVIGDEFVSVFTTSIKLHSCGRYIEPDLKTGGFLICKCLDSEELKRYLNDSFPFLIEFSMHIILL
jgi:hypothetical protein